MATVPMIAPDGSIGDVPAARAHEAAAHGFKVGAELMSPDGKLGVLPMERVHDAMAKGFQLKPPDVQRPAQPDMHADPSALGSAINGVMEGPDSGSGNVLPSPKGQMAKQTTPSPAVGALTVGGTAALAAGSGGAAALPFLKTFAQKHPLVAATVAQEAISQARQIPGVGRFVPHFAELLPFLAMGGKGGAGAAAEAEGAAAAGARTAKPAGGSPIYRDATLNRRNIPEFAGEEMQPAPPNAPSAQAPLIKATSNQPIAQPSGANEAVERQVSQTKPTPTGGNFGQSLIVPSTRNIRENRALTQQAESVKPSGGYSSRDSIEDRGINQEWNQNLERHGADAEEEMRREFAAGSTTGVTKQELTGAPDKPVVFTKTKSASGRGYVSGPPTVKIPGASPSDDMTPILQRMLDNARKGKSIKQ